MTDRDPARRHRSRRRDGDGETLDGDAILIGTLTVDAVLFDLDGTLVDSVPDLQDALNRLLMSMQRRTLSLEEVTRMVGDGAPTLIERSLAATGAPPSPQALPDLIHRFLKLYKSGASHRSKLYPDSVALLEALKRAGIRLGLVTNKPISATREVLDHFRIDHLFDAVVGGDSLAEKKPSGLPVVHVLERLGVASDRAALVGDMPNDFNAARAADVRPIIVTYGYAAQKPAAFGARETVDRLRDLPELLGRPAPPEGWAARALRAIDPRRRSVSSASGTGRRRPGDGPGRPDPEHMDETV